VALTSYERTSSAFVVDERLFAPASPLVALADAEGKSLRG